MHELSLMGDILNLITTDATDRGIKKIDHIHLIVGELSNAMPDALDMAFSIFKAQGVDILSPDSILTMDIEKANAQCVLCELEYEPDQRLAVCPNCLIPTGKLISGDKFSVEFYKGS